MRTIAPVCATAALIGLSMIGPDGSSFVSAASVLEGADAHRVSARMINGQAYGRDLGWFARLAVFQQVCVTFPPVVTTRCMYVYVAPSIWHAVHTPTVHTARTNDNGLDLV